MGTLPLFYKSFAMDNVDVQSPTPQPLPIIDSYRMHVPPPIIPSQYVPSYQSQYQLPLINQNNYPLALPPIVNLNGYTATRVQSNSVSAIRYDPMNDANRHSPTSASCSDDTVSLSPS